MDVQIKTDQIKILEDFFEGLSSIDQRKVFMASFRRAAKPLIAAEKSLVPYRTGNLRKSIGSVELRDEVAILIGAKLSGRNKGWYAHLVEGGTTERFRRTKKGAPTGRMAATPFVEKAYNMTKDQMYDEMEQAWYDEIDRFIMRTNKRLKK